MKGLHLYGVMSQAVSRDATLEGRGEAAKADKGKIVQRDNTTAKVLVNSASVAGLGEYR